LEHRLGGRADEPADEKLMRLEQENDQLRQERDILKKAIAYFAHPPKK
jgi:transposase-like protein